MKTPKKSLQKCAKSAIPRSSEGYNIHVDKIVILAILAILIIIPNVFTMIVSSQGGKGKISENFVFIQTNIDMQYPNDRDVIWQVRTKVYKRGIPQSSSITLYFYDEHEKHLLDTESPNPMRVEPGSVASVNFGKCDVGLYRCKIVGESVGIHGELLAQWAVAYPPHDYYFCFFAKGGGLFGSDDKVVAEFESQETYIVHANESINKTAYEDKKSFELVFYTYMGGGKVILEHTTDCKKGRWEFHDIYETGIYCDVIDEHGWYNAENKDIEGRIYPYHWMGSRKMMAFPRWTITQLVVGIVASLLIAWAVMKLFKIRGPIERIREWRKG